MPRPLKTKRKARPQPAAKARKDVAAFRESLWKTLERNCEGLSAADVVKALRITSDDIYQAGVDEAYTRTRVRDPRNVADAWDLTWLTALSVDLRRRQQALGKGRPKKPSRKAG
jgi:hypothetical protein